MQLSEKARKALAAGLAVSTLVWSFAMVFALPVAVAAPHSNGCLVLSGGTVWLLENGTRRGFTSAEVFASHGYNFGQVVAANSEDAALPVGPIMTYADGTLVKGPSDPLVYLVANGQKRGFVSGSVFTGLGFSFANIQSAPVNTFSDLPTGANLESATERHTAGVLVNSSGTVWKMTATGRMGIPSMDVFNSYGSMFAKVVAANSADLAAANEGLVTARAACPTGTTPPPPVSGALSVSLASSNPAASTVVAGQAIAHLASFNLSNGSSSEAKVTTLKLKRLGVSADTTLAKVYLYDGETRLTDDAAVSSGVISWNNSAGLFSISGNSSRIVQVKSNIAASTNGETVGVGVQAAADVVVSGPSSVAGSFPVNSNIHTIASATLAAFDLATSTTPSANTSLDPQEGFTGWQNSVSVGTRAVYLKAMNFRVIGSIVYSDLKNFKLLVDGVQVGSTVATPDANGYVLFDTSATPKKLETGTRVFKVNFDVVGGSNRNFQVSLRHAADASVTDSDFGSNILIRGDGSATTNTYAEHITGLQTVAVGTLTVSRTADSPSGNVVNQGTGVTLGKFELKALGEKMKVENLRVAVDTSSASTAFELRNGALFVNGLQVGSTAALKDINDATAAFTEYSLGSALIVEPGTPKMLEIRADVFDNDGTNDVAAAQTLIARVAVGSSNVQRMTSAGFINVPASVVTANTLTVTTGSIALAKNQAYGNQSVVVPASAYKIGVWTLTGGSTEAVNLDTIQVDLAFADEFAAADLTNVYVKYGSKVTSLKSASAATQSWSVSETLPINGTLAFEFYGDIATAAVVTETTADTVIASLLVSGTSASSGTAVNTNSNAVLAGQTITGKLSGTLTVSLDNGTPLAAQAVAGAMAADGSLKVKLAGTNEDLYVKLVTFRVDANADDVALASLTLYSAASSGSFAQVSTSKTWDADGANPGFVTWELSGTDRVKVAKDGTSYLLLKPTYVSSDQGSVSGLTPQIVLLNLDAEGTGLLAASGTGSTLINASGIVVQSNSSATYVDSTEDTATTALTATATTLVTANGIVFTTGDTIFIDEDADATWDAATEELMTVILDGGANLTVTRNVYGTTSNAHTVSKNIYRLDNASTTRGVIGNAQTVLKTKLALAIASDSPSGATTSGTQKVVFKFTATAANNSADVGENKATINWVELTTNESAATVTNLSLYPSEFDQNTTYGAACGGVSTTLWRCTLVTTSGTNDVIENTSRTYVARADVGYSGAGSVDVSVAALGTSDAAGNDVNWSDGTTTVTWVNQATTTLQGGSQTTAAASGTADTTAPTISTTAGSFAFGGTASNTLVANDTITITFTEEVSAASINSSLLPGGAAVTPSNAATGDVSLSAAGLVTVVNIATTDVDGGSSNATEYGVTYVLNTAGTVLTITLASLTSGTGALSAAEVFGDVTGLTTTVTDVSGVAQADSAINASGDI